MKTFKQFILEDGKEFDLEKFKSDCAFVLGLLKGKHGTSLLYHGTTTPPAEWEVRSFKERSKPRDSSVELHNKMNNFFKEKYGAPARNWLFTSGHRDSAAVYNGAVGRVLAIFPIGKFDWICGLDKEFHDLTTLHDTLTSKFRIDHDMEVADAERAAANMVIDRMRYGNWNHNTNLPECIASGNEIVIKCDKFYAVNTRSDTFTDTVLPFLESL